MKTIEQQKSLKAYNTFGVECFCEYFTSVSTTEELVAALLNEDFSERFILGGGSNLLFTKNLSGLCIHIGLKGIRVIEEDADHVIIEAKKENKALFATVVHYSAMRKATAPLSSAAP